MQRSRPLMIPTISRIIVSVVRKEADSVRQSDFIFALIDDTGAHLAGNVSAAPSFVGWRWIDRSEIAFAGERDSASDVFLAQWRPLSHGKLLVGLGNREVRQMGSYLISVLGYGVVGTGIVISILSVMLAAAAQRRIFVFAKTLAAVSRGQIRRAFRCLVLAMTSISWLHRSTAHWVNCKLS